MKNISILSVLAVCAAILTGCEHLSGVSVGGGQSAGGGYQGTVVVTFKRLDGSSGSVTIPRSRGITSAGDYATLGEIRALAVNAFNNPANRQPRLGELNGFDLETVAIVIKSLTDNGAVRGTAQ